MEASRKKEMIKEFEALRMIVKSDASKKRVLYTNDKLATVLLSILRRILKIVMK